MVTLFDKIKRLLGIDRSIMWASSGRVLPTLLGPIGSIIVVFTLSKEDQGLYYLFLSLLALKSFFDLGASAAIAQMTPHSMLIDEVTGEKSIDPQFARIAIRIIRIIAIAFAIGCSTIGVAYLIWSNQTSPWVHAMWLATVAATALAGSLEAHIQLVYGSGKVDEISKMRLSGIAIQYPTQWLLLLCGLNLFSFVASTLALFAWNYAFLRRRHRALWNPVEIDAERNAKTRRELIGLIKRASVTYISGFMVFQIQQPIIFKLMGAEESAKLGFTSLIGSACISLSAIWGLTTFPKIAAQVSDGCIAAAFGDFKRTWLRATTIATLGVLAGITAIYLLSYIPRFAERLMPIYAALPLFGAMWLQNVGLCAAYWPRAFKIEPFAIVAVIQMFVTPLAVFLCVKHSGLNGVGYGNLISWLVGAAGIFLITKSYLPGKTSKYAAT